ncbi:MAG TPA: choice-of-anchor Q domain-containing protein [Polyangiaceae bacterium]|nr:choice-of-anchor Q domain-containing protein [Polyangiaceae bacterium]
MSWPHRAGVALTVLALATAACDPKPVQVTTTADVGSGSLRAAIDAANAAGSGGARIELPTGTYQLTRCGVDDTNGSGDLDITTNAPVSLVAVGPNVVIVQTCPSDRVLDARGTGLLSLSGVALAGGSDVDVGGGLQAQADVIMSRSSAHGNSAKLRGGGVYVRGRLTLTDSRVFNNRVSNAIFFPAPVSAYVPGPVHGAGIHAHVVEARNSTVDGNQLLGCTYQGSITQIQGMSSGGGIAATSVSLVNSTISDNLAPTCPEPMFQPAIGVAVAAQQLALDHVTIADNLNGGALSVSELSAHRSAVQSVYAVCSAGLSVTAATHNWFTDSSCALPATSNRQENVPFLLAPLADNGGPVPTRLPGSASVLLNRVPVAACPVTRDARGVTRPQGSSCDIGAVELEATAGDGPADFALRFTDPPTSWIPGNEGTWKVTVTNRGPNPSPVVVVVDVPAALSPRLATATGSGTCELGARTVCTFDRVLPGTSQTISIAADLIVPIIEPVTWSARLNAPDLAPPFTDDQATLTTPVVPNGRTHMNVSSIGSRVNVDLFSDGPGAAIGTHEDPITVSFEPAPGVRLVSDASWRFPGVYSPSALRFAGVTFSLAFDGAPPAVVGTVRLSPGITALNGPATLPVSYVPPPDVQVRAYRSTSASSPASFTLEISNVGGTIAREPRAELIAPFDATVAFTPSAGFIEKHAFLGHLHYWNMPDLLPGARHTLTVNVSNAPFGADFIIRGGAQNDFNETNNEVILDVGPAPDGFADVVVSSVEVRAGANASQRIVRAIVTNLGPAATLNGSQGLSLLGVDQSLFTLVSATASRPGWTCQPSFCQSTTSLRTGTSVSFDFVMTGDFSGSRFRPGVELRQYEGLTVDPVPHNNVLYAP